MATVLHSIKVSLCSISAYPKSAFNRRLLVRPRRQKPHHHREMPARRSRMQRRLTNLQQTAHLRHLPSLCASAPVPPPAPSTLLATPPRGATVTKLANKTLPAKQNDTMSAACGSFQQHPVPNPIPVTHISHHHSVDFDPSNPFHQKSTCITRLTLGLYVAHIWSRGGHACPRIMEEQNPRTPPRRVRLLDLHKEPPPPQKTHNALKNKQR